MSMSDLYDERAGLLATSIQGEVRGHLERKFNELKSEFQERFNEAFEDYRQRVLTNIKVTQHHDVVGDTTRLTFDMKISAEEMDNGGSRV